MSNVPTLTLSPQVPDQDKAILEATIDQLGAAPAAPSAAQSAAALEKTVTQIDRAFSKEEQQLIEDFSKQIDVTNPDHVMMYGADAQKKVSAFADTALESVKSNETGEVGSMLVDLVTQLKGFDATAEEPKGLFGRLFRNANRQIEELKARYDDVSVNVEKVAASLEAHQVQLLKDVAMFNHLYDTNLAYFRELTMYIIAGEKCLEQVRSGKLADMRKKAENTGDSMDAQAANDLAASCDRFEKKLHDLKLTRQISLQMAPQIRLLQNNNALLIERIQSTMVNTLPLWKNQMVLALGLHHSTQAMQAQRAVTDMTNQLLKSNAEKLKQGTIETAREAERGIIDIETLTATNQSLIDTINEVMQIQTDGRQKRREAERQLTDMENQLKQKLLDIR